MKSEHVIIVIIDVCALHTVILNVLRYATSSKLNQFHRQLLILYDSQEKKNVDLKKQVNTYQSRKRDIIE